jgi:hypothetical protein
MAPQPIDLRLAALRRFAGAITVFNLLGHVWFGFEQAWATPLLALATGYAVELLLEWLDAHAAGRRPRFLGGGIGGAVDFLLPAHITALAVSMLLYAGGKVSVTLFATALAIVSKYLFRVTVGGRPRHFFNPSNFGISVTLLLFHWVAIAPPYMFTENLTGNGAWILPAVLVCAGTFLNARFTKRLPLIATWLSCFAFQALARCWLSGRPLGASLLPMTGMAFLLFTFYMVSDPSTTPFRVRGQVLFGAGVAAVYGLLLWNHVVFTLFFSLSLVCLARGASLWLGERQPAGLAARRPATVPVPVPAVAVARAPEPFDPAMSPPPMST